MLCYGIKSAVHSIRCIDISDFMLWYGRPELGVICVYNRLLALTHCMYRAAVKEYCRWVLRRSE